LDHKRVGRISDGIIATCYQSSLMNANWRSSVGAGSRVDTAADALLEAAGIVQACAQRRKRACSALLACEAVLCDRQAAEVVAGVVVVTTLARLCSSKFRDKDGIIVHAWQGTSNGAVSFRQRLAACVQRVFYAATAPETAAVARM
jgi:hypothetical protein